MDAQKISHPRRFTFPSAFAAHWIGVSLALARHHPSAARTIIIPHTLALRDHTMSLQREIDSFGSVLLVDQDFKGELGATVWDAAIVLCKYFENIEDFPVGFFKNKKVIELGAGTGLVGLALSRLGSNVTLTDQKQMLPLLQHNAKLNNLDTKVNVEEFNWGEQPAQLTPPYDIVLLSDLIAGCYASSYQALVDALWWLTESGDTSITTSSLTPTSTPNFSSATSTSPIIIMSYEKRDKKELDFFSLLLERFSFTKVPNSKLDPLYQSEDIGIFIIKRK